MIKQFLLPGFAEEDVGVPAVQSFDMSHLYLVRHGSYEGRNLTDDGRKQIRSQFDVVRKTIDGGTLYIVSSEVDRAVESAEILAEEFGVDGVEKIASYLYTAGGAPMSDEALEGVLGVVDERKDRADGLVIVSHYELVRDFPVHFMRKRGMDYAMCKNPDKGCLHHIDILGQNNTLHYPIVDSN